MTRGARHAGLKRSKKGRRKAKEKFVPPQGKYNPRRWMYVFVESNFFGAVMMGAIVVSLAAFRFGRLQ